MPGGDRRGPLGAGPMTGRASGLCAGNTAPGYLNRSGRGRFDGTGNFGGRGRGFRRMFCLTGIQGFLRFKNFFRNGIGYTMEEETQHLKNQSGYLAKTLEDVNMRLSELEKDQEKE